MTLFPYFSCLCRKMESLLEVFTEQEHQKLQGKLPSLKPKEVRSSTASMISGIK